MSRPGAGRRALATVVAMALLTACTDEAAAPGRSTIEVDTPELRATKSEIGVEPCVPGTASGGELPALELACLGGGPAVDLASLTGPLMINLWASNCGPCRTEMPALQQFHENHGEQVAVLGIDFVDTQPAAALALMRETGATYPSLADPGGELLEQDDVRIGQGLPQFVLLDAEGHVAHQQLGGLDTLAELEQMVTTRLGVDLG